MKHFHRFEMRCPSGRADELIGLCQKLGTMGIEETDTEGGVQRLVAYFDRTESPERIARALMRGLRGSLQLRTSVIDDADWLRNFREGQLPIQIGRSLLVVPSGRAVRCERIAVRIPVERAFGTGSHESTRGCLILMESLVPFPATVLDVGTGSGILAIAAARLGARHVDAIDVDPEAVSIARRNVRRNSVGRCVRVALGDAASLGRHTCRLVTANLTAEVIVQNAPCLAGACSPGGYLIVSGILRGSQAAAVRTAIRRNSLSVVRRRVEGEWVSLLARRPARQPTTPDTPSRSGRRAPETGRRRRAPSRTPRQG